MMITDCNLICTGEKFLVFQFQFHAEFPLPDRSDPLRYRDPTHTDPYDPQTLTEHSPQSICVDSPRISRENDLFLVLREVLLSSEVYSFWKTFIMAFALAFPFCFVLKNISICVFVYAGFSPFNS